MTVTCLDHPLYSEVRLGPVVAHLQWVGIHDLPVPVNSRLLLDYSAVTCIEVPLGRLISTAEAVAEARWKVAVLAPTEVIFGICRQVLNLAHVEQGVNFAAFKERDPAIEWLLREEHVAEQPRVDPGHLAA